MSEIPQPSRRKQTYRVTIGHAAVTVEGRSREDALRIARKQLCLEMPRLWEVIHRIDDRDFHIDPAH